MRAIFVLMAAGSLVAQTSQLPASCGGVGAKSYTPPAVTIPAPVLNRGTVITVTNATSTVNGDTSSVAALMANPGPDGISLWEAVTATNNDPGTWNIQFARALKGGTISGGLPYLGGGNVTINGDIDGDGTPDITLTSGNGNPLTIFMTSGGNTLNGLALQDCIGCITIQRPSSKFSLPAATNTTFSNITISNLAITISDAVQTGVGQNEGIVLNPTLGESDAMQDEPAPVTGNTWDHILITGNTITGVSSGTLIAIDLSIGSTVGDTLQHTVIANNNITLQSPTAGGIQVGAGSGLGSSGNQMLDTLIANNVISLTSGITGIHVATGVGSASNNSLSGVEIIGNQVHLTGPGQDPGEPTGISIYGGDATTYDFIPPLYPIQYSRNNTISNVSVLANTITGSVIAGTGVGIAPAGVQVQEACCGNRNNTMSNLSIQGNTITGVLSTGMEISSGASGSEYFQTTTADAISNVSIQANTIQMAPPIYNGCNCYPGGLGIALGGIQVWVGWEEPGNSINGLTISNNDVDTPLVGIGLAGGLGGGGVPTAPVSPANDNVASAVQISCNQVDQAATVALEPYTGIKGINVVAGVLNASGNQVQVSAENNLVGGVMNDVSYFGYLGSGGSENSISISESSGSAGGAQIAGTGLVNGATFQQDALAPGSLVSLFGSNLNGATVQFGGIMAPISYASSTQLNLQVPWELQGQSSTSITVAGNSVGNELEQVALAAADPGIFSLGAPQGGQGAIVNLAGAVVNANAPAQAGDYIQIYANGLGMVTNTPPTGGVTPGYPYSFLIHYPAATIGGVPAPVTFAGLAPGYVGLYQVNVQVPAGVTAGDGVPVILSIGAQASNTVTISVR